MLVLARLLGGMAGKCGCDEQESCSCYWRPCIQGSLVKTLRLVAKMSSSAVVGEWIENRHNTHPSVSSVLLPDLRMSH